MQKAKKHPRAPPGRSTIRRCRKQRHAVLSYINTQHAFIPHFFRPTKGDAGASGNSSSIGKPSAIDTWAIATCAACSGEASSRCWSAVFTAVCRATSAAGRRGCDTMRSANALSASGDGARGKMWLSRFASSPAEPLQGELTGSRAGGLGAGEAKSWLNEGGEVSNEMAKSAGRCLDDPEAKPELDDTCSAPAGSAASSGTAGTAAAGLESTIVGSGCDEG